MRNRVPDRDKEVIVHFGLWSYPYLQRHEKLIEHTLIGQKRI